MQVNDVLRRRQTPISSGFRQGLIDNDHLNNSSAESSYLYPRRTSRATQEPIVVNSTYVPPPPETFPETFQNNPSKLQSTTSNYESLLYLNTPKAGSIRRAVQSQTPSRTSLYNSDNNFKLSNPAHDLGSNSLLSYGCCCIQCVRTTEVGIVENFGRFEGLLAPGLHILPWPLVDITGRLSLRINQLEVSCETKTADSVFCTVEMTLQYRIIVERAYDAYYRLTDPSNQIQSYVFDVVRSKVPKMTLEEVFASKASIAQEVKKVLKNILEEYGYEILYSLTSDIRPADSVVQSLNEINASKRLKVAMVYKAEAEKIKRVKDAEAHCEALYLHGVGIAGQRKALTDHLKEPFRRYMAEGNSQREVMNLLFMTQYMDTLAAVTSASDDQQSLLIEGNRGNMFEVTDELQAFERKSPKIRG